MVEPLMNGRTRSDSQGFREAASRVQIRGLVPPGHWTPPDASGIPPGSPPTQSGSSKPSADQRAGAQVGQVVGCQIRGGWTPSHKGWPSLPHHGKAGSTEFRSSGASTGQLPATATGQHGGRPESLPASLQCGAVRRRQAAVGELGRHEHSGWGSAGSGLPQRWEPRKLAWSRPASGFRGAPEPWLHRCSAPDRRIRTAVSSRARRCGEGTVPGTGRPDGGAGSRIQR
jgi:hypothetical protein